MLAGILAAGVSWPMAISTLANGESARGSAGWLAARGAGVAGQLLGINGWLALAAGLA